MEITKYRHACMIIKKGSDRVVIDPGELTTLPDDLTNITTVVVTEEHFDHFSIENLERILKQSPDAEIFAEPTVAETIKEAGIAAAAAETGEQTSGPFRLTFQSGEHAPLHVDSPCPVVTVQVDDFYYYAADSYIPTKNKVTVLGLPTGGPWHKLAEAIDYAMEIDCEYHLVTHNYLYNAQGQKVVNNILKSNLEKTGREYIYLEEGSSRQF